MTAACRTELLQAGIGYATLQADRNEPLGVGVRLLLKNYRYRLEHICGLQNDQGAVRFMLGQSLAGYTTADHYRSFTSEEGQAFLRLALDRDGRFETAPRNSEIQYQQHSDGSCVVTVPPPTPNRLTAATVQYLLQPGDILTVTARGGVQGQVKTAKARNHTRSDAIKIAPLGQISLFISGKEP